MKFYFHLLLASLFIVAVQPLQAQNTQVSRKKKNLSQPALELRTANAAGGAVIQRCVTAEYYKKRLETDPAFKTKFENNQRRLLTLAKSTATTESRLTSIHDTIAVVIHVVGNASLQTKVTDAILRSQIDVLNEDYNGKNADSIRIPTAFKPLFGNLDITFMLAGTDVDGSLTTGIERRTNTIDFTGNTANDAKRTIKGGLDAWDPTKYLNLWVVEFTDDVLGISVFPGDPDPLYLHGFVCDYRAFGRGAPYLFADFNKGRTTTHELGHFLNLRHIWGDVNNCLTTTDFPGAPAGQDDTPKQYDMTFGNPDLPGTGTVLTDQCNQTTPGIMYQNYMDYSDDVALVMFTKGQSARMQTALTTSPDRSGMLNSLAYQPGGVFQRNVGAKALVFPDGDVVCKDATIFPKVRIKNASTALLTSVTVNTSLNNGTVISTLLTVNVVSGAETILTLPSLATTVAGTNNLTIFFTLPNGAVDQYPLNDTIKGTFTVADAVASPLVQKFDDFSAAFPPAYWSVLNPENDITWTRTSPGHVSNGSLFINNYNNDVINTIDDFKSNPVAITAADSLIISFDLASKIYPDPDYYDTLSVLISTDCGNTFTSVYKKWGYNLATAGQDDEEYLVPADADWRLERIALAPGAVTAGRVIVILRNTNRFGNNIFIDNINVVSKALVASFRDLTLSNIIAPVSIECGTAITPKVVVSNTGQDIITAFKVGYRIGNGANVIQTVTQTLNPGSNATITLAASPSAIGVNTITVFTADPVSAAGTGDHLVRNDTLQKQFSVPGAVTALVVEGFTGTTFAPANWAINNPDGGLTWQRYATGLNSTGSAYINTFNYSSAGQIDELYSPSITIPTVDSAKLTFDVATALRNLTNTDTLSVLITKDCGATFTPVYKKWGAALQTNPNMQATEFFPITTTSGRKETIDLTSYIGQSPIMLVFRVTNGKGNNIFLDNINVSTRILPAELKSKGYLMLPNPFSNQFNVWFHRAPADLRNISVYDLNGKMVWTRSFTKNTANVFSVDLSGKPAGTYVVKIGYANAKQDILERVIKR